MDLFPVASHHVAVLCSAEAIESAKKGRSQGISTEDRLKRALAKRRSATVDESDDEDDDDERAQRR